MSDDQPSVLKFKRRKPRVAGTKPAEKICDFCIPLHSRDPIRNATFVGTLNDFPLGGFCDPCKRIWEDRWHFALVNDQTALDLLVGEHEIA